MRSSGRELSAKQSALLRVFYVRGVKPPICCLRLAIGGLAAVLLFLSLPAEGMRIESAVSPAAQESASPSEFNSPSEFQHVTPGGDLFLKVSFLPVSGKSAFSARLPEAEEPWGIGRGLSRSSPLFPEGTGSLKAEYRPSPSLLTRFSYLHTPASAAERAEGQSAGSSLGYDITYTPSANSRLTAAWKWLQRDGMQGSQRALTASESTEIGYELRFAQGLIRLGHKASVNSSGPRSTGSDSTSMHIEWKGGERLSLAGDYAGRHLSGGEERRSTLKGKMLLSPRANLEFDVLRREASGGPDESRSGLSLTAEAGSKRFPLKLTGRMAGGSIGSQGVGLREIGFQGGASRPGLGLKFSGKVRDQQGTVEGKPGGRLQEMRMEGDYGRLKLSGLSETFQAEEGSGRRKSELRAGYSLSQETEVFWLSRRDSARGILQHGEMGLKHRLRGVEVAVGHGGTLQAGGEQEWNSLQLLWKAGEALPEWAKGLGEKPAFEDGTGYGFRPSPVWAKAGEPGLEVSWKRRSSGSGEVPDSLRLVYRRMAGRPAPADRLRIQSLGGKQRDREGEPLAARLFGSGSPAERRPDGSHSGFTQ